MKIIFNEYEKEQINKYAEDYGIASSDIERVFCEIYDSNFEQDLWDIINLNAEELGVLDNKQGDNMKIKVEDKSKTESIKVKVIK